MVYTTALQMYSRWTGTQYGVTFPSFAMQSYRPLPQNDETRTIFQCPTIASPNQDFGCYALDLLVKFSLICWQETLPVFLLVSTTILFVSLIGKRIHGCKNKLQENLPNALWTLAAGSTWILASCGHPPQITQDQIRNMIGSLTLGTDTHLIFWWLMKLPGTSGCFSRNQKNHR